MRLVALLLLSATVGCGSSSSTPDARTDPAVCLMNRESNIDRSCSGPSDCGLVASGDCCGTVMIAVRAGTEAAYPAVESAYQACLACPPLGCQHADLAEDGKPAGTGQTIVATCVANRCTSVVQ